MSLRALRIVAVIGGTLHFEDPRFGAVEPGAAWMARHEPEPGGYYVIDEEGHGSFATALPDDVPAPAAAAVAPAVDARHPQDHFRYDWLETCLTILAQQGEALLAAQDEIKASIAELKAQQER